MAPKTKNKPNVIIDGDAAVVKADWFDAQPKVGKKKLDQVEAYLTDEATAKQLDPPGKARQIAEATKRAHSLATGLVNSGLAKDTLCELIATKAPFDKNGNPTSVSAVERVIRGMLKLNECLAGNDE